MSPSPLRIRMIEDMSLVGLAPGTRALYISAVRKLAAHYRRSPGELSEEEVRSYLVGLRDRGVARGTFNTNRFGIQFLYRHTLDRDWALFSKKKFVNPNKSACPMPWPTIRSGDCWAA